MTSNPLRTLSILAAVPMTLAVVGMACDSSGLVVSWNARIDAGPVGSGGQAPTGAGGAAGTGGRFGSGGAGGGPGTGGRPGVGGAPGVGGGPGVGGITGLAGAPNVGGVPGVGGKASGVGGVTSISGRTGGNTTTSVVGSGGRPGAGGTVGSGGAAVANPPTIGDNGYVKLSAGTVVLMGYISSSTAGSGSSISLTYDSSSYCATGKVAANSTYNSWAVAGFSVNQDPSGASGTTSSLVLTGSTISLSYVNHAGTQLEFQLYDGSNYWCYMLPPAPTPTTTTIPFSSLNTQCWNGLGSPFTSGTAIRSVNLQVPGSNVNPTPFDFCFLGMSVN